ncbi:MAG: hypothetical protein ABSH29_00825 [Acidimicrobiales bacterium]|jgi:hypothetical protein
MSEPGTDRATLFLSRAWKRPGTELSFVTRALAGAASRTSPVTVLVPSAAGPPEPDGAFDLIGAGVGRDGSWPAAADAVWPGRLPAETTIVIDEPDPAVLALLDFHAPGRLVHTIMPTDPPVAARPLRHLRFTGSPGSDAPDFIGLHVPINPLAATHRHNGLGFTGYLLVLSDRVGPPDVSPPTPMVAWLTARFPDKEVVVVEDATAAVWRGRVLRGIVDVYTRTDLWRLVAHARVTVDLAPGPIIARECVESLRFGTPILVPAESAARPHAEAGGGMTFSGYPELLAGVAHLFDESVRATMSSRGRSYADTHYGDQRAFVDSVARALGTSVPSHR